MNVLVISDTHGLVGAIQEYMDGAEFDCLIHLGDHNRDVEKLTIPKDVKTIAVAGNCDESGNEEEVINIEGISILLCHGHRYGVKNHHGRLLNHAKTLGVSVVIFGHTHVAFEHEEEDILLLNPGSAGLPRVDDPATALFLRIEESSVLRTWVVL